MASRRQRDLEASMSQRRYLSYTTGSGSRWVVPALFRQRSVGVAMYVPYSLGGYARKALMLLGAGGARVDTAIDHVGHLEPLVVEALGRDDVAMSWYVANRRSESKTSALAIDEAGRAVAFVKLAVSDTARRSLARERNNLQRLEEAFDGTPPTPVPLRWQDDERAAVLVTTTAPTRAGPTRFVSLHDEYLTALSERFGVREPFIDTACWREVSSFVDDPLFDRASDAWKRRFQWGLERLRAGLCQRSIATTLAHRDFAPWNTRVSPAGLYAFDWEFAACGYPVAHDYFHFEFMVGLLLRNGASPLDARRWVGARPTPSADDAHLLLAYLLDLARQYHGFHHDSSDTPDDTVLRQAGRLLDGASQWLPR